MPDQELTEIVIVLDRSGSMSVIRADMEGGLNAFLAEQRNEPGRCVVSLFQFDSSFERVFEEMPIERVPRIHLVPRSMTALLDAMGNTITLVGERLAHKPDAQRPGRVIVVTITDGQENASREFDRRKVSELVTHQTERYGWQFAFLGANIDSFAEARSMGYSNMSAVMNYEAQGASVRSMGAKLSAGVSRYRRASVVGTGFAAAKLSFDDDDSSQGVP